MKLKKKLLSLLLVGALLFGVAPTVVNAQGQWSNQNGKWYYNNNGSWTKGWLKIGNQWYYFNANSEMHTGWLNDKGSWYYLNNSGTMHKGWLQQGTTWYYLDDAGSMVTYNTVIDGKTQRFSSEGVWLGEVSYNGGSSSNSTNENSIVWRAGASTKYYHSSPNCSNMKSPIKMTLKDALSKNLKPCSKCH